MSTPNKQSRSIPDHLRKSVATPGSALRRLLGRSIRGSPSMSHLGSPAQRSPAQPNVVVGKNPDELSSWMQSIRARVSKALSNDDQIRQELDDEETYERRKREIEKMEEDTRSDDSSVRSSAFEKLGSVLTTFYAGEKEEKEEARPDTGLFTPSQPQTAVLDVGRATLLDSLRNTLQEERAMFELRSAYNNQLDTIANAPRPQIGYDTSHYSSQPASNPYMQYQEPIDTYPRNEQVYLNDDGFEAMEVDEQGDEYDDELDEESDGLEELGEDLEADLVDQEAEEFDQGDIEPDVAMPREVNQYASAAASGVNAKEAAEDSDIIEILSDSDDDEIDAAPGHPLMLDSYQGPSIQHHPGKLSDGRSIIMQGSHDNEVQDEYDDGEEDVEQSYDSEYDESSEEVAEIGHEAQEYEAGLGSDHSEDYGYEQDYDNDNEYDEELDDDADNEAEDIYGAVGPDLLDPEIAIRAVQQTESHLQANEEPEVIELSEDLSAEEGDNASESDTEMTPADHSAVLQASTGQFEAFQFSSPSQDSAPAVAPLVGESIKSPPVSEVGSKGPGLHNEVDTPFAGLSGVSVPPPVSGDESVSESQPSIVRSQDLPSLVSRKWEFRVGFGFGDDSRQSDTSQPTINGVSHSNLPDTPFQDANVQTDTASKMMRDVPAKSHLPSRLQSSTTAAAKEIRGADELVEETKKLFAFSSLFGGAPPAGGDIAEPSVRTPGIAEASITALPSAETVMESEKMETDIEVESELSQNRPIEVAEVLDVAYAVPAEESNPKIEESSEDSIAEAIREDAFKSVMDVDTLMTEHEQNVVDQFIYVSDDSPEPQVVVIADNSSPDAEGAEETPQPAVELESSSLLPSSELISEPSEVPELRTNEDLATGDISGAESEKPGDQIESPTYSYAELSQYDNSDIGDLAEPDLAEPENVSAAGSEAISDTERLVQGKDEAGFESPSPPRTPEPSVVPDMEEHAEVNTPISPRPRILRNGKVFNEGTDHSPGPDTSKPEPLSPLRGRKKAVPKIEHESSKLLNEDASANEETHESRVTPSPRGRRRHADTAEAESPARHTRSASSRGQENFQVPQGPNGVAPSESDVPAKRTRNRTASHGEEHVEEVRRVRGKATKSTEDSIAIDDSSDVVPPHKVRTRGATGNSEPDDHVGGDEEPIKETKARQPRGKKPVPVLSVEATEHADGPVAGTKPKRSKKLDPANKKAEETEVAEESAPRLRRSSRKRTAAEANDHPDVTSKDTDGSETVNGAKTTKSRKKRSTPAVKPSPKRRGRRVNLNNR